MNETTVVEALSALLILTASFAIKFGPCRHACAECKAEKAANDEKQRKAQHDFWHRVPEKDCTECKDKTNAP